MQFGVGFLFFFLGDGHKGWSDAFRKCAASKEPETYKEPLIK